MVRCPNRRPRGGRCGTLVPVPASAGSLRWAERRGPDRAGGAVVDDDTVSAARADDGADDGADRGTDGGAGGPDGPDAEASEQSPRRARRRRANVPGGRHHVHKVRVTPEEEALLLQRAEAQRITVARLLVEAALSGDSDNATERRNLLEELFAVHRLLASLANNVNQIARATNATSEVQPETRASLAAVRRVAERLDDLVDELSATVEPVPVFRPTRPGGALRPGQQTRPQTRPQARSAGR